MVEPISKIMSRLNFEAMQKSGAEQDPGWRSDLSIHEINRHLEGQRPFTYIISSSGSDNYLLSYVREDDHSVIHIQFDKLRDGNWHYVNGQDNIIPSLKGIIKKMMHLEGSMHDPTPFAQ